MADYTCSSETTGPGRIVVPPAWGIAIMTANQLTALEIASRVLREQLADTELNDKQWALVLLASSLGHTKCSPHIVCGKIIADFRAAAGFFADISAMELAEWEARLPVTPPLPPLPEFPAQFPTS